MERFGVRYLAYLNFTFLWLRLQKVFFPILPFCDEPRRIQYFDQVEVRAHDIALRHIIERPEREIHNLRKELIS